MAIHLHGATTTTQLHHSGFGNKRIASRVRSGELIRVQRRLYRHAVAPTSDEQLVAIGLLAVRGRGAVTSALALRLQGYTVGVRRRPVDITVPHGSRVPSVRGVHYRRSSHLGRVSFLEVSGLTVAPAGWAMGDLAYDTSDSELSRIIARAIAERRTSLDALEGAALVRGKFPGGARLRRIIEALRSDLPFSGTEHLLARALREAGHNVRLQHRLEVPALGRSILLDLALPEIRYNIEVDGPHHWMPEQAAYDRIRDRGVRAIDWTVDRFPVYEIDRDIGSVVRDIDRRVSSLRQ